MTTNKINAVNLHDKSRRYLYVETTSYYSRNSDFVNTFSNDQSWWEMFRYYFVNIAITDKNVPRNINVSFTNNTQVPIDTLIFIFIVMNLLSIAKLE